MVDEHSDVPHSGTGRAGTSILGQTEKTEIDMGGQVSIHMPKCRGGEGWMRCNLADN